MPKLYSVAAWANAFFGDKSHVLETAESIRNQEKRGGAEVLVSTNIPKDGDWKQLKSWGFKRGRDVDNLFVYATLPRGWEKKETSGPRYVDILDARSLKRVSIFVKDVSYERKAHFRCNERFYFTEEGELGTSTTILVADAGRGHGHKVAEIKGFAYAIHPDGDKVGLLRGNTFYFHTEDGMNSYGNDREPPTVEKNVDLVRYKVITGAEFYSDWHNNKDRRKEFALINAHRDLLKEIFAEWISANVQGDPWGEQNDFLAIEISAHPSSGRSR